MADKAKKALDILVAFGKPKSGEEPAGAPGADADDGDDTGLVTAMEEFIAAVKSSDADAAAAAFKSAMELC